MPPEQYGEFANARRNVTPVAAASYDLRSTDDILDVTYTATGDVTIRLMTVEMVRGRTVIIKDGGFNASVYNITVTTEGAEKIDGQDTFRLDDDGQSITVTVNAAGTGWMVT